MSTSPVPLIEPGSPFATREGRLLIISPVRNEAEHIERVVRSVGAQTRVPDLWIVADDGSVDSTREILEDLAEEFSFMRVLRLPRQAISPRDRLASALEARAFNRALASVEWSNFDYVGKLDGDMELPVDYFEAMIETLDEDPLLGLVGGSIVEPRADRWTPVTAPSYHVHGALKLYTRDCFALVGGIRERLGWDTIDETYARMAGLRTRRLPLPVARHLRPTGNADGKLRGRMREGACAYVSRYGAGWVFLRSFKVALRKEPRFIAGALFLWGYLSCVIRRSPRVEDPAFKAFVRAELRDRMFGALRPRMLSGPRQ